MIGPDGPLALVPFEALLRREGDATRMALERWEIAYVPSATVLAALREGPGAAPRGQGVVALGDPERRAPGGETARRDEKGPLPATADEAKAIGALFPEEARVVLLGAEATRSALRAALERPDGGRLRALHLACHAEIDLAVPGRSALILAGGERLELDDVYGWRVPSDLTVLSACATGVGPERQGEGILGLARGFFLAGSPRVVVTNWRVADRSSCALMTAFYERMIRDGLPAAAALREAKRALAAPGGPLAHPFHWAGFVLWGLPD
jgi:CHAT domain-containing protein